MTRLPPVSRRPHHHPRRWLRSWFFHSPILCYQSTPWLRFSKKLSVFSHQPSEVVRPLKVQGRRVTSSPLGRDSWTFDIRRSTFNSLFWPQNGGFVPDFSTARSFIINQLGGFVFQEVLRFQRSAVRRNQTG